MAKPQPPTLDADEAMMAEDGYDMRDPEDYILVDSCFDNGDMTDLELIALAEEDF